MVNRLTFLMDRTFVRNFLAFVVILLACAGTLAYALISGDRSLGESGGLVLKTHDVIMESQELSTLIEGMLSAQRGYLITGDEEFLTSYELKKNEVSQHIARLSDLNKDDAAQQSRLDEIRGYFLDLSAQLESRATRFRPRVSKFQLENVEVVNNIKDNIIRVNNSLLKEGYDLLNERIVLVEEKKAEYFNTLLVSVIVGTVLLLVLNGYLLYAQRRRNRAEASLKDTEERFALAIDGTQDGIFDWDVRAGQVFYSRQFFGMLGYNRKAYVGDIGDFKALIHPDDVEAVWRQVELYLDGGLSEYRQDFRMKHDSGRWIWIQSRAKALFDRDGKAYRMVGAHTDITHTVKEQERLEAEKEAAEAANQAKSDFLAHMSHEIRTPLTAINGIAEIFTKNQDNFDDKQKQLIGTLMSSTASLKDLINDILDFSKIENGDLELDECDFSLAQLFEEVISMMSLRAGEKGVSFIFDYSGLKQPEFRGDPKRLRQIIVNLIANAIKFTDQGGVTVKADVETRDGNDFLRIAVSDTGIGIAPEHFDLVFERFKQADSSVSRKYGGTGLGLPISKNLAFLMGGNIFISSQVGKGSTFTVLLPMKLETQGEQDDGVRKMQDKLNDKIRAAMQEEKKILMVEDYEGNVVVLSYILEEIGTTYDVANTGAEAVDLWSSNHYDMILMDIQMPEMDGFTATKEIRRLEDERNLDHTPIIGMTAHALVGDKDKCIEAGMDSYLPKPIVEADLKREILKYLEERKKAA